MSREHVRHCLRHVCHVLCVAALFLATINSSWCGDTADVDALLASATRDVTRFTFDQPRESFRQVRSLTTPDDVRWQQATFGLAMCQQQLSPALADTIKDAVQLYNELVERAPQSLFAPRAQMNLGRIAELSDFYGDVIDLVKARICYRAIIARWPTDDIIGETILRLAGSYVATGQPADVQQAVNELRTFLATHGKDPMASALWQYLGDTEFYYHDDKPAALEAYRQADVIGLSCLGRESVVWWRMAVLAEQTNNRNTAIEYYQRICADAQTSGRAFEAQMALARLGVQPPELTSFSGYQGRKPVITVAQPEAR